MLETGSVAWAVSPDCFAFGFEYISRIGVIRRDLAWFFLWHWQNCDLGGFPINLVQVWVLFDQLTPLACAKKNRL